MTINAHLSKDAGLAAFERLAASANDELLLCLQSLDPQRPLHLPELRARGLQTWADLLAHQARRGVRLRLIMADPDPLLTSGLHRQAWAQASGFADALQGDVQILCARHGHGLSGLWRAALRAKVSAHMRDLRAEEPTRLTPVQRAMLAGDATLRPASIHQSCAVADSTACMIGLPASGEASGHDPGVSVSGDLAAVLRGHLAETWNTALQAGAASLADRALPMDASLRPQATSDLRLVRTLSEPAPGAHRFGPRPRLTEHEATLTKAIDAAQRHIYIETALLRHMPIAQALARAAKRAPALQLILVLPTSQPPTGGDAWDAQHGPWLQHRALEGLRAAFGNRLALVAPTQGANIRATVVLIDDTFGLIGSASLSGRAMLWNLEASVAFRDSAVIADLRRRLSTVWLGQDVSDPTQAATWTAAAQNNADLPAAQHRGHLQPYAPGTTSKRQRLLPDALF